ncbi:hypothetical protein E2C01_025998 [Portunus trituberculatus]|uniref:Uncharacterized protein n=1 Tax=Portunus trituberculatus TaxID=210409 RepID=A0A5B7EHZ7_PORTR|nr:hypothetical protein [Portunus trituberculatus]
MEQPPNLRAAGEEQRRRKSALGWRCRNPCRVCSVGGAAMNGVCCNAIASQRLGEAAAQARHSGLAPDPRPCPPEL